MLSFYNRIDKVLCEMHLEQYLEGYISAIGMTFDFGNIDMSKQGTAPRRLIGAGQGEGMDITPAKPNGRPRKAC